MAISQDTAASWENDRRNRNCLPEIAPQGHFLALRAQGATAPLGPRNDKSGAFAILTAVCTDYKCVAGPGCPLPYIGRYGPARLPWAQSALAMTSRERLPF